MNDVPAGIGRPPPEPPHDPFAPKLVGRDRELTTLRDVIGESRHPFGVVIIEGEAGIGKSRVLAEALGYAREAGFTAFYGRSEELESSRPFAPVAEAFGCHPSSADPSRAEIGRLLSGRPDELTHEDQGEVVRYRVLEAFIDLIEAFAIRGPVALALEDLHWADATNLLVLRSVARRLAHLPISLMLTLRSHPRTPELQKSIEAFNREGALHFVLSPLEPDAVSELITASLRAKPGESLTEEVSGAGGNPLFIIELLNALDQEGSIDRSEGRAEVTAATLPPTLRLTILRRISFLDPGTLDILRVASMLGSTFHLTEVAQVLQRPMKDVLAGLSGALETGIVAARDDKLSFRHDLIREAIYGDLPEPVRSAMHLEAAGRLDELDAPPERIARQLVLADLRNDRDTMELVRRTAGFLRFHAMELCLSLYQKAIRCLPPEDARRDEFRAAMLRPMISLGRLDAAEEIARSILLREHPPEQDYELRNALRFILWRRGRVAESHAELRSMHAEVTLAPEQRLILEALDGTATLFKGDAAGAAGLSEKAAAQSRAVGDDEALMMSVCAASWAAAALGDVSSSVGLAVEARECWERGARRENAHLYLGVALLEADRFDEAKAALEEGSRAWRGLGDINALPAFQWAGAGLRFFAGEWDDALAETEAGFRLIEEGTGSLIGVLFGHGFMGQIALRRGDLDKAEQLVSEGERELEEKGPQIGADFLLWTRALLHEAAGDIEEAYRVQAFSWDITASIRYFLSWRLTAPDLVRWALAVGDRERASSVTDEAEEGARRAESLPSARGAALRCRALLDQDPEMMVRAVEAYGRSPRLFECASTCDEAARLFAARGDVAAARPLFSRALDLYDSFGASREASRATAEMRRLGIRRGSRSPRRRPAFGWESLTATEHEVVKLTVEGLTNPKIAERLFISKHTVSSHLLHVFAKLGISSRVELAAFALKQGA